MADIYVMMLLKYSVAQYTYRYFLLPITIPKT